jgi:hypothetical protein
MRLKCPASAHYRAREKDSLAEGSEFQLPVPVSKLSDDNIIPEGAAEDTGRHAGYFI